MGECARERERDATRGVSYGDDASARAISDDGIRGIGECDSGRAVCMSELDMKRDKCTRNEV